MRKIAAAVCGSLMLVTTVGACSGDDNGGDSSEALSPQAFCKKVSNMDDGGSTQDKIDMIKELADQAPEPIAADMQAMADAVDGAKTDDEAAKAMQDPEVAKHVTKMGQWLTQNCQDVASSN